MAKLKAPLFSFSASGQLAKSLVYFPWKGLRVVREHVVPANPRSSGQTTQRAFMTAAVDEFHTALYSAIDVVAWALLGTLRATPRTGFNEMVKAHIDEGILGNTWEPIHDVVVSAVVAAGFQVNLFKVSLGNAPTIRYGTRKTFLPNTAPFVDQTGDDWEVTLAALAADTVYYFSVDSGASGVDFGRVGIYSQRTAP